MHTEITFDLGLQDYTTRKLLPEDIQSIQVLFEKCLDFMLLVDGRAANPEAAAEELQSVPPGKTLEDKFLFGIFNQQNELVGYLDAMRGYPDAATWWIGLLLFVPEVRSQGLGQRVTDAFIEFVRGQGCQSVMLGVVEENKRGLHFWESMGFGIIRQTEPRQFGNKIQTVTIMRRHLMDAQKHVV